MKQKHPNIVVIGGGTGSFVLLGGLKQITTNITALVNMADDGGSTGQLRDELGVLPPGDVRQCLVALSNSPKVRELFNYRFDDGSLSGHAIGNLFLTGLEKMTGSFAEAVEVASEVLNITGRVEPVTLTDVTLCMRTADGKVWRGQFEIGHASFSNGRPELWLEPEARLNPNAAQAIAAADVVVVAPGNLYGSLAPALIVPGMGEALVRSRAKKVYVCNLVTGPGQIAEFKVHDFAAEIERFVGADFLDYVLYNDALPSESLLRKYASTGEHAVAIDTNALQAAHYKAKGAHFIANATWHDRQSSDPLGHVRTLIRHDSDKVARAITALINSEE